MEVSTDKTFVLRLNPYAEARSYRQAAPLLRKSLGDVIARGAAGPRRRAVPIKFRRRIAGAQVIVRIFTGSISYAVARMSASSRRLTVRDVRLAALSRSLRERAPRLQPAVFFRRLVELQWDLSS
jgi:hypothetical protein